MRVRREDESAQERRYRCYIVLLFAIDFNFSASLDEQLFCGGQYGVAASKEKKSRGEKKKTHAGLRSTLSVATFDARMLHRRQGTAVSPEAPRDEEREEDAPKFAYNAEFAPSLPRENDAPLLALLFLLAAALRFYRIDHPAGVV